MTFATAVPVLFTSFVHCTNMYWSVIHGIKRKPHLSVVWNWYHFVAIAILHDFYDINMRLQLSDTSSIPPMHGGFLLWYEMDPTRTVGATEIILLSLALPSLEWSADKKQQGSQFDIFSFEEIIKITSINWSDPHWANCIQVNWVKVAST